MSYVKATQHYQKCFLGGPDAGSDDNDNVAPCHDHWGSGGADGSNTSVHEVDRKRWWNGTHEFLGVDVDFGNVRGDVDDGSMTHSRPQIGSCVHFAQLTTCWMAPLCLDVPWHRLAPCA